MDAPCKDCLSRTIPKSCEGTCAKWKAYVEERNELKSKMHIKKQLDKMSRYSEYRHNNGSDFMR